MGTQRIEIPFKPGAGQIVKETSGLAVGEVVEFWWRTTKSRGESNPDHNFKPDLVKNGNFTVTANSDNNCVFTGEYIGPFPEGTQGLIKSGSGASSFNWPFKKSGANDYSLQPDTEYTVRITITVDGCTGLNGKVNAGPDH